MDVLKGNKYTGFISFKMFPFPDSDTAAKRLWNILRNCILEELKASKYFLNIKFLVKNFD